MRAGDDGINAVLLLRGVPVREPRVSSFVRVQDDHVLSFGFFFSWWLSWNNRIFFFGVGKGFFLEILVEILFIYNIIINRSDISVL